MRVTRTSTRTSALAALAIALVACSQKERTVSNLPIDEPAASDEPVAVRMLVAAEDGALAVSYSIENRTPAAIWVLDTVLERHDGGWRPSGRAIVSRGEPGLARLVLGYIDARSQMPQVEQGVARTIAPIASRLEPGDLRKGVLRVALPLAPWHPYLEMAPLRDPERIVLEVGYLTSEPPWSEHEVPGGRVPALPRVVAEQQWARSAPVALP